MKVTFLVPDIGWPIVGIAARMAKYIQDTYDVDIVGPALWGKPNVMYEGEFDYHAVDCPRLYRFPEYFREVQKLADALTGDIIISMKAFGGNLPAALHAKQQRGARVIAYLDEWDGAVSASWTWPQRIRNWAKDWMHPCNNVYVPRVERRLAECDERLVTTRFLEQKFDGRLFHIGIDTDTFSPQSPEAVANLKRQLSLQDNKLLVFGGVARPHKGLDAFAEALAQSGRTDCRLIILGPLNEHVQHLMDHPVYGNWVLCPAHNAKAAREIHDNMPLYLALADILIVPLDQTLLAQSQMPCKVFEAMAMEKPIIASAVSDLPEVLGDGGYLVPPDNVQAIAEAINEIIEGPEKANQTAQIARSRCIEKYSAQTSQQDLLSILATFA